MYMILAYPAVQSCKRQTLQLITQCYKHFTSVIKVIIVRNSVCPWQALQPSLMMASKPGAYPSETPFR